MEWNEIQRDWSDFTECSRDNISRFSSGISRSLNIGVVRGHVPQTCQQQGLPSVSKQADFVGGAIFSSER